MPSVFFCKLQLITVLLLICASYMSWSTRFVSLKLCVGFSIFDFAWFLLKFIFLFSKMHGLFDFKTQFISELNNEKATNSFTHRPLLFKFQQEVWKFNDICVSWSSPKPDLETNCLNLENRNFENVSFCTWLYFSFSI